MPQGLPICLKPNLLTDTVALIREAEDYLQSGPARCRSSIDSIRWFLEPRSIRAILRFRSMARVALVETTVPAPWTDMLRTSAHRAISATCGASMNCAQQSAILHGGYANGTGATTGNTVYDFSNSQTSDGTNVGTTGNGLASALLSYPSQVSSSDQHFNLKYRVYAPYVQDRWKLTPRLSINFGLRLDYFSSPYITDHGLLSEFDPNTGNYAIGSSKPLAECVPAAAPCIPTGSGYTSATGNVGLGVSAANHIAYEAPNNLVPKSGINLGPRLGVAYALTPKTAVRAGFGMVSDVLSGVLQTIQANIGAWPDSSQTNLLYNPTSPTTVPTTTLRIGHQEFRAGASRSIAFPGGQLDVRPEDAQSILRTMEL